MLFAAALAAGFMQIGGQRRGIEALRWMRGENAVQRCCQLLEHRLIDEARRNHPT